MAERFREIDDFGEQRCTGFCVVKRAHRGPKQIGLMLLRDDGEAVALQPHQRTHRVNADATYKGMHQLRVEMKAAPVYFADNYFQPKTFSQPKIYVTTSKQVSSFSYLNQNELIRLDEVVYEEIKIKGKKAEKYPEELTAAIKNTNNYSYSDYVFLLQEARDVIRNKNYRLKLTTQLDPKMAEFQSSKLLFTHFLPGNFHYLFFEKDTLAIFSISRNIVSNRININYDRISNGYDSTGIFSFNSGSKNVQISHAYIVTGKIGQNKFQVRCSDFHNTIKEIYLNEKLICIAQGKFSPEKFVIFDASLSAELLIQLFIIGFNTFFET